MNNILKKLDNGLEFLNTNKYFTGIMMILLNIGSRYVAMDLSETQQRILSSVWVRRALVFTIVFIATRDIKVSLLLTLMFVILISGLFNGKSRYCILPKSYLENFNQTEQLVQNIPFPKHPKKIFTCLGFNRSTIMDRYIAKNLEQGTSLILAQHGGNYFQQKILYDSEYEPKISDQYLTWGNIGKKKTQNQLEL